MGIEAGSQICGGAGDQHAGDIPLGPAANQRCRSQFEMRGAAQAVRNTLPQCHHHPLNADGLAPAPVHSYAPSAISRRSPASPDSRHEPRPQQLKLPVPAHFRARRRTTHVAAYMTGFQECRSTSTACKHFRNRLLFLFLFLSATARPPAHRPPRCAKTALCHRLYNVVECHVHRLNA